MSDQAVNTKRSFIAHGALMSAARIVCQQITLKQMQHCFPNYDHESDFFKALAAETVKLLETSFQHAWVNLSTKGLFAEFVTAANALDRIESDAEDRQLRHRRVQQTQGDDVLPEYVLRGKDPKATIPAKTLEGLQAELDNLRKTKEAIAAGNEAKMQRVLKQHKELQTKEERLTLTLDAMKKAEERLARLYGDEGAKELQHRLQSMLSHLGSVA